MDKLYIDRYVEAKVGSSSLVGIMDDPPVKYGNYFSLWGGQSIVNMWAENLEDAVEKFLTDRLVKIRDYGKVAIIIDERIPKEYYYNNCCFTGSIGVTLDIAKNIYETLGDPNNQLLRFIDFREYHRLKGNTVRECKNDEGNVIMNIVTYPINQNPNARKLKSKWTVELDQDITELLKRNEVISDI